MKTDIFFSLGPPNTSAVSLTLPYCMLKLFKYQLLCNY